VRSHRARRTDLRLETSSVFSSSSWKRTRRSSRNRKSTCPGRQPVCGCCVCGVETGHSGLGVLAGVGKTRDIRVSVIQARLEGKGQGGARPGYPKARPLSSRHQQLGIRRLQPRRSWLWILGRARMTAGVQVRREKPARSSSRWRWLQLCGVVVGLSTVEPLHADARTVLEGVAGPADGRIPVVADSPPSLNPPTSIALAIACPDRQLALRAGGGVAAGIASSPCCRSARVRCRASGTRQAHVALTDKRACRAAPDRGEAGDRHADIDN
jgi:hypothetical protein